MTQWLRTVLSFFSKPKYEISQIKHLALIMDGNRRWARKRHLTPSFGHKRGTDSVRCLIEFCLEHSIGTVSVYTFSLENFSRPQYEIDTLFDIMIEESKRTLPDFIKHGVKVSFIGDKAYFPAHVVSTIEEMEHATQTFTKLQLNVLFCYGGRQEIVAALKDIVHDVQSGTLQGPVTNETFEAYLWSSKIPDPDLIIRTGGVKRLSNFLLYKAAYSELYFTDRLWPDLTKQDLEEALRDFALRKRNYGT
jgi:undecaprenyl diphosphate synthase